MVWRAAESLKTIQRQLNNLYPNRGKASDGFIGDKAHQAQGSASDHNPWFNDSRGVGVVTAFDITHDPQHGVDISELSDWLMNSRDPRIKYVIANGLILIPYKVSWASEHGWFWQEYDGDPHTSHLHLSVNTNNYDDAREWNLTKGDEMSTVDDYEVEIAWPKIFGYAATKADKDAWRGAESNTALRAWIASPQALAYEKYKDDLKKAAASNGGVQTVDKNTILAYLTSNLK